MNAADRNRDGRIHGEAEIDTLVALLDRIDGRADRRVTLVDGRGERTAAASALEAIQSADAQAPLLDLLKRARLAARHDPAVIFIGMQNDSARREIDGLRTRAPVLEVTDRADGAEVLRVGGRSFDLRQDGEVRRLCGGLGLPAATATRVGDAILGNRGGARRELASLAMLLAPGERGLPIASRLVVSGHGDGTSVFGHQDDQLADTDLMALALAMPRAAAQIEHVHMAACQHGWEPRMEHMRSAFPRLESMWGYTGFSPSGDVSVGHERIWERDTRRGDAAALDRRSVAGTHLSENAAVWTAARGFDGSHARELGIVMHEIVRAQPRLDAYLAGTRDLDAADLRTMYDLAQEVVQHTDARAGHQDEAFNDAAYQRRDQVLRLRFYDHVATRFAAEYAPQIERGYAALGLAAPNFAELSRGAAMGEIGKLRARLDSPPVPAAAVRLEELLVGGLVNLDERVIPTRWL